MFSFDGVYGKTRTRNGMLGSFSPSLLAPMYLVMLTKKDIRVTRITTQL